MMHGREKSDFAIVAMKPANKAGQPAAEWVERRVEAEGNTVEPRTRRTLCRASVPQWLARVRQAALCASPSLTRGGSPVRKSRTPGSVRGVPGNGHPYRDRPRGLADPVGSGLVTNLAHPGGNVISAARQYSDEGGLMSYGANFGDLWRQSAAYVDKILKGAKPGDPLIEQPTKFELVVNLKTAKALGITIPESILLRADEVIR